MTEDEIRAVLDRFPKHERAAIELQREQLTEAGVTREPLRTEMACALASVLLDQPKSSTNRPGSGRH